MPTTLEYRDGDERAPGMFFLREALDCENLGVTVVDVDPNWTGMDHDHAADDHEEVYVLVGGGAVLTVEGDHYPMKEGTAVRVEPGATRQLVAGDDGATLVVAGAP
ncbi:MAG: cupin domain protein [uncultured archaeon A07HB70]|nr:MAG: cupin domain protein [uncultured archaeon A07HB70]